MFSLHLNIEDEELCYLGYTNDYLVFNQASLFQSRQVKRVMSSIVGRAGNGQVLGSFRSG